MHEAEATPRGLVIMPALVLLGLTLPGIFLVRVEQYLYYLRPAELLPTFATAWLLLAALSVPLIALCASALALTRLRALRALHPAAVALLFWAAAVAALIPLLMDGIVWAQTFSSSSRAGLESSVSVLLTILALGLAIPFALTRGGRRIIAKAASIAAVFAALGALSLLSLFFFRWDGAAAAPTPRQPAGGTAPPAAQARAPNILLLTIDALSAQHMSLYGAARATTPALDAFAAGASVFERAYANSNFTTSSVSSILTATRPWTHRAFQIFSWPALDDRRDSLPAELERAGYTTGYVATNSYAGAARLGFGPYFNFGASDQVPMDLPCADRIAAVLPYACPASQLLPLLAAQKLWFKWRASSPAMRANRHYDPAEAVDTALGWLEHADRSRPIFLWVHLFPPHAPYAAPEPWLGQFDSSGEARDIEGTDPADNFAFRALSAARIRVLDARYDEAVRYVDSYAGSLLERSLAILGENTAVVVAGDHGENFAPGYGGHGGPGLYEGVVHVPLIIKLPRQSGALRFAEPVEQIDIAPTLTALAGIPVPASWEGRSLLPLWQADPAADESAARPVFSMNFEENPRRAPLTRGAVAVIEGPWKLIRYLGTLHYPSMPPLADELYDLGRDPQETVNRAAEAPGEHQRLGDLISRELERYGGRPQ